MAYQIRLCSVDLATFKVGANDQILVRRQNGISKILLKSICTFFCPAFFGNFWDTLATEFSSWEAFPLSQILLIVLGWQIVMPQFDWLCDMCGCVMSPTLDIYWVELGLINNYKERFSLGRYIDSLVARSLIQPFFNFPLLLCLSNVSNIAWCCTLVNIFFDLSCKRFVSIKSLILICLER